MDCDSDMTCVPLVVFMLIETAAPLRQPFSKCRALHFVVPSSRRLRMSQRRNPLIELAFRVMGARPAGWCGR
jgi:hypothetical protein